jgi:hypothetical protein
MSRSTNVLQVKAAPRRVFGALGRPVVMCLALGTVVGVALGDQEGVVILGRVLDAKGGDASGIDVAPYWSIEGEAPPSPSRGTTSDARGQFRLVARVDRFPVPVVAMDASRALGALAIVASADLARTHRLRLEGLGSVRGELRSRELKKPVTDLSVSVRVQGSEAFLLRSRSARFAMSLPAGTYDLVVTSDVTQDVHMPVTVESSREADVGIVEALASDIVLGYGNPAPPLTVQAARGLSTPFTWAAFAGKWVLLEFWSHSSGASTRGRLPQLVKFHEDRSKQRTRFEILAFHDPSVGTLEELDASLDYLVRSAWDGKALPFPVLIDASGETAGRYRVRRVPATYLVDPQGRLTEGNLDALAVALDEGDPELEEVLQRLSKASTAKAVEPLLDYLVRSAAPRARERLLAYAASARGSTLPPALSALGRSRSPEAVAYLMGPDVLTSKDPVVQDAAIEGLEASNDKAAIKPLLSLAVDKTTRARIVARALRALFVISPSDPEVARSSLTLSRSADSEVRAASLPLVARLGTDEANQRIGDLLRDDKADAVRAAAAHALARSGDPTARSVLLEVMARDRSRAVRAAAAEAIASMK